MKIALAADHGGFELKEKVKRICVRRDRGPGPGCNSEESGLSELWKSLR
jgi:ribose 5-phosphate isomerase RpiB